MSNNVPKWNEEREATLTSIVGSVSPVTAEVVTSAAETLETTTRSVASKLRKMGFEVDSVSKNASKSYTEAQEAELVAFVAKHEGQYTYAEIAASVFDGAKTAKQIQGKILSMELTGSVKATPKVESVKTYSDAEEAKLEKLLAKDGVFMEDIAEAMGRPMNSVRGKILSMSRTNDSISIPKQKNYVSKDTVDPIEALGDISDTTVEDIAEKIGKTVRGVKTMLTHRKLTCKNYDGAKRAAKLAKAS